MIQYNEYSFLFFLILSFKSGTENILNCVSQAKPIGYLDNKLKKILVQLSTKIAIKPFKQHDHGMGLDK